MKKKLTNIILIIVVIVIWTIGIKGIVNGLDKNDDELPPVKKAGKNPPFNDYAAKKDTSLLLLNYRDPFHSAAYMQDTIRASIKSARSHTPLLPKPKEDLSFIKYSGYIYNPSLKKTISVLIINGKSSMVTEGEAADGIRLIKNMRDSVKINYKNKILFIART